MFKKLSFIQLLTVVTLFTFSLQTELQSNELSHNTQLSVSYADKNLEKKFNKDSIVSMFTKTLTQKEFYSKKGHYLLRVKVQELTSSSTKSSTEATSSIRYEIIDTLSKNLLSTATISMPHRELNYANLAQKEIETFTIEKSLQKNISKYLNLYFSIQQLQEQEEKDFSLSMRDVKLDVFAGIGLVYSTLTNDNITAKVDDTKPQIRLGFLLNQKHRFYFNYENFKSDLDIYTINYDYVFLSDESIKPYLGFHVGNANINYTSPSHNSNDLIYGAQVGILFDIVKHLDFEIQIAASQFNENSLTPSSTYKKFKTSAGVNFYF